jgi:hypothetical protein
VRKWFSNRRLRSKKVKRLEKKSIRLWSNCYFLTHELMHCIFAFFCFHCWFVLLNKIILKITSVLFDITDVMFFILRHCCQDQRITLYKYCIICT